MWNEESIIPTGDYLRLILLQQLETMPKLRYPCLLFRGRSKTHNPFTGKFPFLSSHPPSRCTSRWIKEDGKTERLAGVLVTMAASKWNAKAQETDRESRNQVDVMELPVLLIALLHAQFSSMPSPCISASSESGRGAALEWQKGQGR